MDGKWLYGMRSKVLSLVDVGHLETVVRRGTGASGTALYSAANRLNGPVQQISVSVDWRIVETS